MLHPGPRRGGRADRPRFAAGSGRARQPSGPRSRGALRGRGGLRDGRRPGDLRARPRHRDDRPRRCDRRPGQCVGAGGQARGLRPGWDRLPRRALGADVDRRRRHESGVGGARSLCPGRARQRRGAGRRGGRGGRPRLPSRPPPSVPPQSAPASETRRWPSSRRPSSTPRSSSPTPSRPSTSSCSRRKRPRWLDRVTTAGCVFTGPLRRHRLRRLRRRLQPRPADRGRGTLQRPARARRLPSQDLGGGDFGRSGGGPRPARRRPRSRRRLPRPRRVGDD